jgi:hypothetical protein
MKRVSSKRATPKLVVRRETIRELSSVELTRVGGGDSELNDSGAACAAIVAGQN